MLTFTDVVLCSDGSFTITDLAPDEDYELVVTALCENGLRSPESCVIEFKTACENSSLAEDFDQLVRCVVSCDSDCEIGRVWKHQREEVLNWAVGEGSTATAFTGPDSDVTGEGRYLFLEKEIPQCVLSDEVHLISECLTNPNVGDCSVSFYYHMRGMDVGALSLSYAVDSTQWQVLWSLDGDQGENWNFAEVSLPEVFESGLLRFSVEQTSLGERGDIALDEIKLIGIDTISPRLVYADEDRDGFGDLNKPHLVCGSVVPEGYSVVATDCDDSMGSVFPGALEIACNQIDDNCNGLEDDVDVDDLSYEVLSLDSESCVGQSNGIISISAEGGQAPYEYQWSNGSSGAVNTGLTSGVYFCTISDLGGCQRVTDPIFVDFEEILVYSVRVMASPNCLGGSDGSLEILVNGGTPPYTVSWNTGQTGICLLYTSPSPRDQRGSRMPSSA